MPAKGADRPFTEAECRAWKEQPDRNPRTQRTISKDAKKGVYQTLLKQCASVNANAKAKAAKREDPKTTNSGSSPWDKYCRCLMHVRASARKREPPPDAGYTYAVCTNSVVKKHQIPQPRYCIYDFSRYTDEELQAYAHEKSGKKTNPFKLPRRNGYDRVTWIERLATYQKEEVQRAKLKSKA